MGAAYFYHLTQKPMDVTLPMLLGKARSAGWKVLVRGTSQERMDWLDQKLWLGAEESFVPHGLAGGEHDALQPVLLAIGGANPNEASCLMSVYGAEVTPEEVNALDRVCILFEGHDPEAMDRARAQWKALTEAGCSAQYWSEENGAWEKKRDTSEA